MKLILLLTLALSYLTEVNSMSIFGVGKTCVFSSVKVQLLNNGKPVTNAKVIRQWNWNELKTDESVTDSDGYVTFPAVFESSISRLLPIEIVIGQQLSVFINDEEKVFWTNGKRKADENSEYGGVEFVAVCEINGEEKLIENYGSLMVTMCELKKGN